MLGLDRPLVTQKFNIKEGTRLIKQASRNFHPELEVQNKQEIRNF